MTLVEVEIESCYIHASHSPVRTIPKGIVEMTISAARTRGHFARV